MTRTAPTFAALLLPGLRVVALAVVLWALSASLFAFPFSQLFSGEARVPATAVAGPRAEAQQRAQLHFCFVSMPLRGHVNPMLPLAERLRERGHRVTWVTNAAAADWVRNASDALAPGGDPSLDAGRIFGHLLEYSQACSSFRHGVWAGAQTWCTEEVFMQVFQPSNAAMVREALPYLQRDVPDLVVADYMSYAGVDLADALQRPAALVSSTLFSLLEHFLSTAAQPYVPRSASGFSVGGMATAVWQRAVNRFVPAAVAGSYRRCAAGIIAERSASNPRLLRDPYADFRGRLVLIASYFPLAVPRALSPLVHMIGPDIPVATAAPLDAPLAEFLKSNTQRPLLYAAMGSLVSLTSPQVAAMASAFSRWDGAVVWALPESQQRMLETGYRERNQATMHVTAWAPQVAVLGQPQMRVFVSHCGAASLHESLLAGVPLVCVPCHADQFDWAERAAELGIAAVVDKWAISADALHAAIGRVAANASFAERARAVNAQLRSAGGATRAAELLESAVRVGTAHLVPAEDLIPLWASVLLDPLIDVPLLLVALGLTWQIVWRDTLHPAIHKRR